MSKAILVVDMHRSFMPGIGELAVPYANEIIKTIDMMLPSYEHRIFTKDSHPNDHCSFIENGGPCPGIGRPGTEGWDFAYKLTVNPNTDWIVYKGLDKDHDSSSAFCDDGGKETNLMDILNSIGVDEIDVVGVATEYCVKFTVLDGIKRGLKVNLLLIGCRGVTKDGSDAAIKEMRLAGATIIEA